MGCSCFDKTNSAGRLDSPYIYPKSVEGPLVLCIDDSAIILELLEDVLTAYGFRTICTSDCSAGIRLAASEPVDLIVLDYEMPQMNGLLLARELRNCRPEVPLIMFSGAVLPSGDSEMVSRIIPKGEGAFPLASAICDALGESTARGS